MTCKGDCICLNCGGEFNVRTGDREIQYCLDELDRYIRKIKHEIQGHIAAREAMERKIDELRRELDTWRLEDSIDPWSGGIRGNY